jgi:tetratricopeptide (TPR) repeat protein
VIRGAIVALLALATVAHADEQAFRAAGELAAKNDPGAIDAFEAAGAARPMSRWTDDAWVEAARLAEKRSDYDRARRDLEQAIAISTDAQLVRRAKRDLERIVQLTGGGTWSAVAAEHQRLVTAIARGGDPTAELEALEALVRANPQYPRAVAVRMTIARGWEAEDEVERALRWMREAVTSARDRERDTARIELVRMLIRNRELPDARRALALVGDLGTQRSLARKLATAEWQQRVRWLVTAVLLGLAGLAVFVLRRRTGSWRAAGKRLARPPIEVIYFAPIAAVVGLVATTGNPLVAKAVIWIFIGAGAVAWVSGATLEAAPPGRRRVAVHAVVAGAAVLAAVYLAIDHARLLDLLAETWRTGPGH